MVLKLYNLCDSPPTLAVRMCLKHLNVPHELIDIDFLNGEQLKENYLMVNPQGEVPALDDDGLVIGESTAMMQYLADMYGKDETFYPKCPKARAIVNHRLAFNLSTYYKAIFDRIVLPSFYKYPLSQSQDVYLNHTMGIFEEYLKRMNTAYVAGENVTIADIALAVTTGCLNSIDFDFALYPNICKWFENFKKNQSEMWAIGDEGLAIFKSFVKNPPDLSQVQHPIHKLHN